MPTDKKEISPEKARLKMATLCARSEQCEDDILKKLRNLGLSFSDAKDIVNNLKIEKFIDHRRFASNFAHDKVKFAYWGPRKIKAALAAKRIESSFISEALNEIEDSDWEAAVMKCARSKARNLDLRGDENYDNRKKLFVYLVGRGFTSPQSNKAVRVLKEQQMKEE